MLQENQKIKGNRIERTLVEMFRELGLRCWRTPPSTKFGHRQSGDIGLQLLNQTYRIEVKSRREFRVLQGWLRRADCLILQGNDCPPLVVMPIALVIPLLLRTQFHVGEGDSGSVPT